MTDHYDFTTLVELLRYQAQQRPDAGYTFLVDGEHRAEHLSYAELDQRAGRVAGWLPHVANFGDRALILYPPGLDYLVALFGCLYAGVVAVPAFPPRRNRDNPRLEAIAADCDAELALAPRQIVSQRERYLEHAAGLRSMTWASIESADEHYGAEVNKLIAGDQLAVLQYTSGTTRSPHGVMLSHSNILASIARIAQVFSLSADTRGCAWLPPYHDMGLIGSLLSVLHVGGQTLLMPPAAFIQKPARWLDAISRYRADVCGGPNFAYELCVRKIAERDRQQLDLSSWSLAFNGAEPVSAETLDRFVEMFAPCGFRAEAFYPCYGLAEATLIVTGGQRLASVIRKRYERNALQRDKTARAAALGQAAATLVGCGQAIRDHRLLVVDPETSTPRPPQHVGEIWINGPCVAQGYWNRTEETEWKFHARLPGNDRTYLRTGDLGFIDSGELFVTGRVDDLIIVRGCNFFARDIERVVQESHPVLPPAAGAVFTLDDGGVQRLVVVQEVDRNWRQFASEDIGTVIRQAVAEVLELEVHEVVLVKPGSVPKTTSGKVQRTESRRRYLEGELQRVTLRSATAAEAQQSPPRSEWAASPSARSPSVPSGSPAPPPTYDAVRTWLSTRIAAHLRISPERIDSSQPFSRHGLDSVTLVSLAGELESWLGRTVSPTLLYDEPTIEALARRLTAGGEHTELAPRPRERGVYEPIAIVGMGCRFPGAENPQRFWEMLRDGRDGTSELPHARWSWIPEQLVTRRGGFLENVDMFDADFFGIAPTEAIAIDPQHRLLLEVAWEALENAGTPPPNLAERNVGVYVGISSPDYARLADQQELIGPYYGSGNALSMSAHRVSYHFNFAGPSLAVDTACSASLVAVHLACQGLHSGDCSLALAGGVNLILSPESSSAFSQAKMLSANGRCSTFDASADGYIRGEGCGVLVLKKADDAVRDGDTILAIIRGSATNQDGRSNGITAPNGNSQQRLIRETLRRADVQPGEISFVETHGTGTVLGDPIEFNALKTALTDDGKPLAPCMLGAVKTNIGHLESAAGIAGLIKVVLALQHGEIPPNLHFQELNPHIQLDGTRFSMPVERRPWTIASRRLAGVSAFGIGGTNAHVIVTEAPQTPTTASHIDRPRHVLALSAHNQHALCELATSYERFLNRAGDDATADICFSANTGQANFPHRLAVAASSTKELQQTLARYVSNVGPARERVGTSTGNSQHVAFLFTGQGSQYAGMGRQLYHTSPTFRKHLDRCDGILDDLLGEPLLSLLYGPPESAKRIDEQKYTQPALFAIEYALAQTLGDWGIHPSVVMGHSLGEYVAACVAGVFTLEQGLKLVTRRAQLIQTLPEGGQMACLFVSPEVALAASAPFGDQLAIAAINGRENIVISGAGQAVQTVMEQLAQEGHGVTQLNVSHAFHSALMNPILDAFEQYAGSVQYREPRCDLILNRRGVADRQAAINARYWRQHLRDTVHFSDGVNDLVGRGIQTFVEIGPQPTLLKLAQHDHSNVEADWLPTLDKAAEDWKTLLDTLGRLFVSGTHVDWKAFDKDFARCRLALPSYAFQRQRYWIADHGRPDESTLPGPTQLVAQAEPEIRELSERYRPERYLAAEPQLNKLVAAYVLVALRELRADLRKAERFGSAALAERLGVLHRHRRLFDRLLGILAQDGWLQKESTEWVVCRDLRAPNAQQQLDDLRQRFEDFTAEITLVEKCGTQLAEILCGRQDPLQVLFPGGSPDLLEAIYERSPVAYYFNGLIRAILSAAIRDLGDQRPLRVLEIGAGTGGTSSHILSALAPDQTQYTFTDVSPLFLQYAADKFREYSFIKYELLDIESDVSETRFEPRSYDVVIAANVLHATADLESSLRHAVELLAPGGLLIALEATRPHRLLDLFAGLTEGWWKFADVHLRPDCPLICKDAWLKLLRQVGCSDVLALADPHDDQTNPRQAVLIAAGPAEGPPTLSKCTQARHDPTPSSSPTSTNGTYRASGAIRVDAQVAGSLRQQLGAADRSKCQEIVAGHLTSLAGRVLGIDPREIELQRPLNSLGLDSLMAVQLKNRLESDLNISIPVVAFLKGLSVEGLINQAVDDLAHQAEQTEEEHGALVEHALNKRNDRIVEGNGEYVLPLSEGQKALWFLNQLAPESPAYNFVYAGRVAAPIDRRALERSIGTLVDRHTILRTTYERHEGLPVQRIHRQVAVPTRYVDATTYSEDELLDRVRQEADVPFDLSRPPTLRVSVFQRGACESVLVLVVHHIVADLWSMEVLLRELSTLYDSERSGGSPTLPASHVEFSDYVDWEQNLLASPRCEQLWRYWRDRLATAPQVLDLPFDRPRPAIQSFRGGAHTWSIDSQQTRLLRELAADNQATLFTTALAAFQVLLHRYTGQTDILIGTTTANRSRPQWEQMVGYLLNQVVLRAELDGETTYTQCISRTREDVLAALENQDFPFPLLVQRLQPSRSASYSPLFQVMFIWDKLDPVQVPGPLLAAGNGKKHPAYLSGQPLETVMLELRGAPFDLTLIVFEIDGELSLSLRYNSDLFDRRTIVRMAEHFDTLLAGIIANPQQQIGTLPLLTVDEQRTQLQRWNNTRQRLSDKSWVHDRFAGHAAVCPNAVAVVCGEIAWTYRRLDRKANQLAVHLRAAGVGHGTIVGLFLPRRPEVVAAILATWRVGAAYLPLDSAHPAKRLEFMLNDARPAVIITNEANRELLPDTTAQIICIDDQANATRPASMTTGDSGNGRSLRGDDLAYVIYTSGSTGVPKGVMLRHRGLRNLLFAQSRFLGIQSDERIFQFSNLCFDASVSEIALALGCGATLIQPSNACAMSGSELAQQLRETDATLVTLPPSILATLPLEPLPRLRTIIAAGEACSAELVSKWSPNRNFVNAYGPTEATVCATMHHCTPGSAVPSIGRPIANVRVYVLNDQLEPVPMGVSGDMYVAGAGVAAGYLNRPDLEAERFVPNPFCAEDGATMYRTGDSARYRPDGTLEFIGRRDHQVKVRGFRIELGEVESVLAQHPQIQQAVVAAPRENDGARRLVAYVVPRGPDAMNTTVLRAYVRQHLPDYMVPSSFVLREAFPLTPNGKVDRDALPAASSVRPTMDQPYVPPESETELKLTKIWKQVLQRDRIGIHDSFFDLGGASIQVISAVELAREEGLYYRPEALFQYETIYQLARAPQDDEPTAEASSVSPEYEAIPTTAIADTRPVTTGNMVIESLGVYLPSRAVSTDEVVQGCHTPLDFPLERMTGIKHRRVAAQGEYSIDLARAAVEDCLAHSRYRADHIDLLICCNISRYDGANCQVSFEPTTALRLKYEFGFVRAIAFDISNACAGLFTGAKIAEAFLINGSARRAMVVSGEYITHLTRTAQLEIESFVDPRLACLTLGDSGAAMIIERSASVDVGFHELDMYTLGQYSSLCVAKATDQRHGGAIMLTDPVKSSAVTIREAVSHAREVLDRNHWKPETADHLIIHQTSETTLDGAVRELNDSFGREVRNRRNTISNLAERGNTATTTQMVAVMDKIRAGEIQSGSNAVFVVTGSGQTVGTALYTFDDLPDRILFGPCSVTKTQSPSGQRSRREHRPGGIFVESIATLPTESDLPTDSRSLLRAAGESCLEQSAFEANDVALILQSGVYRTDYLCEPALAAIVAGDLRINTNGDENHSGRRSFAFDLMNGSAGSLNACHVAAEMMQAQELNTAMVLAAEIENNEDPADHIGLEETASAIILVRDPTRSKGFGPCLFQSFTEHIDELVTHTEMRRDSLAMSCRRGPELEDAYVRCITTAVDELLQEARMEMDAIDVVVPPQISSRLISRLASSLAVKPERMVYATSGRKDLFTSSLAHGLAEARRRKMDRPGRVGLIISVGAGVEVGCALYWF